MTSSRLPFTDALLRVSRHLVVLGCAAIAAAFSLRAATIVPHSAPLEFLSDRYGVEVNGQPVPVFLAAGNVHFASFDFTATAEVRVTINPHDYHRIDGKNLPKPDEFWQGNAIVRPLSRRINVKTAGRVASFTVTRPGQFSVERPGTAGFEDEVLFLFANPPERDVPAASDPNVIFLGPGLHQRSVDLRSNQTLYLAPGAVLFGAINIWHAENVRICGRGTVVYCGPQSLNIDTSWKNEKNFHPLTTHDVKSLTVEGVTFVGRSRGWTIQLWKTVGALFANIKVIAVNPANLNGDGIDWYDGGHAVVRDSFFRTCDDSFAFYAAESSQVLYHSRYSGSHLPGGPRATPVTRGEVTDITIERCVLWPTVANIVRAGFMNQALTTRNIVLRDIDVIHMGQPAQPWMGAYWSLFSAVSTTGESQSLHTGYTFENVRFESPAALFGINWPQATLRNFRFANVSFAAGTASGFARAQLDGVHFENVSVRGKIADRLSDLDLKTEGELRDIRFAAPRP